MKEDNFIQTAGPIRAENGRSKPLPFPLTPFSTYRLTAEIRSALPAYWVVDFFNSAGEMNYADCYSGIDGKDGWQPLDALFMARAEAVKGTLCFQSRDAPVDTRNITLQAVEKGEALTWMDRVYGELPPIPDITPFLPTARADVLPRLRQKMKDGRTIKLAALGDSISNDLHNGLPHLLWERRFPGSTVNLIHANSPAKTCRGYREDAELERLVIRHRPDVFTVAGMGQGTPDDIRTVIAKVHAACGPLDMAFIHIDIGITSRPDPGKHQDFMAEMREIGESENFAVLDMTTMWDAYLELSSQPHEWFMRDAEHANDRGKQIMARIYDAVLAALE